MGRNSFAIDPPATGTIIELGEHDNDTTKPRIWKTFAKYACFDSEAERQWWNDSGALIARFISLTKADVDQQYQYLLFVRQVLIPALGPYPPVRRCCINTTEIGMELSLNFQGPGEPVFRVSIDPVSTMTSTPMDPLNINTVNNMVTRLASMCIKGFDRTLHHHFTSEFCMPEQSMRSYQKDSGEAIAWSQTILAFDFKDSDVVTKQYIWTRHAAHASGLHPHSLIRRAISRVEDQMHCSAAVELVLEYMEKFNADIPVPFFSWDLVVPTQSRFKLYGIAWQWSWAKAEEVCTMGGKVAHQHTDLLKKLWHILKLDEFTPTMGFTWNYEVRPGQPIPDVRLYLAICDRSDEEVAKAVAQWFELLGWHERARSYPETLRYLHKTKSAHTWLSVTVSEKGVYTSLYYHPLGNGPDDFKAREKWF